jgi:hypothetical protein
VIFSSVILGLAGLSLSIARRTTRATDQALVMATLVSRVDRAATVAFDSIATIVRCDTTFAGRVVVSACVTDSTISARLHQLRVVVQTTVPGARPDTITFQRGKERRPIPLR